MKPRWGRETKSNLKPGLSNLDSGFWTSFPQGVRKSFLLFIITSLLVLYRHLAKILFKHQDMSFLTGREDHLCHCAGHPLHGTDLCQEHLQRDRIRRLHLQDKTLISRHMVTFEYVFVAYHVRRKALNVALVAYGHPDKGRDTLPYLLGIEQGMVTLDDVVRF